LEKKRRKEERKKSERKVSWKARKRAGGPSGGGAAEERRWSGGGGQWRDASVACEGGGAGRRRRKAKRKKAQATEAVRPLLNPLKKNRTRVRKNIFSLRRRAVRAKGVATSRAQLFKRQPLFLYAHSPFSYSRSHAFRYGDAWTRAIGSDRDALFSHKNEKLPRSARMASYVRPHLPRPPARPAQGSTARQPDTQSLCVFSLDPRQSLNSLRLEPDIGIASENTTSCAFFPNPSI
jgi:hypothetical protein